MGWWNIEPQVFCLELSDHERTMKQLRMIPRPWNHGFAIEISIVDSSSHTTNAARELYNRWIYDHGPALDCPEVANEMAMLSCGDIRGDVAKNAMQKIFRAITGKHQEVERVFNKYFPRTAEQMRKTMRIWIQHDQKNNGIIVEQGAGI